MSRKFIILPEQHNTVIKKYNDGMNMKQIANEINVSKTAVRNVLLFYNTSIRDKTLAMRKYTINEYFFDKIDNEEKSYFLGLMYADGYNNGKNAISIRLQEKDLNILYKFQSVIGHNGKLYYIKKNNVNCQNQYLLVLNSKKLSNSLTKLGCFKNKSLNLKFPTSDIVPENLLFHFIRGYFDGDGSIMIKTNNQCHISVTSSNDFIDGLISNLIFLLDIKGHRRYKNNKKYSELIIGGNKQAMKFLKFLYTNSTIYLQRKHDKYLLFKNDYE